MTQRRYSGFILLWHRLFMLFVGNFVYSLFYHAFMNIFCF